MDKNDVKDETKILLNDKDIDKSKKIGKIRNCINNFFKTLFQKNAQYDTFFYKNKSLENTFWSSQIIYTRILLISCIFSFIVSWNQNVALIGENGLTPAKNYVDKMFDELKNESIWVKFQTFHSIFWFIPASDFNINLLAIIGIVLSCVSLLFNYINLITLVPIYIILQSIYSIGNIWFNYVYEIEILELLFLCFFLVPFCGNHLKKRFSPTCLIKYICRCFVFKVLIGTSLIRFRNSDLWGKLLGKYYLYETQPLPTIISYLFHSCITLSKLDNIFCILTECVFSFLLLFPIRSFRLVGGSLIFIYCILNFITGNSYLFYFLLIAPLMFCFDDKILLKLFFFKCRRYEIINIVKEKLASKNKSKRYFKSFDIFYFTGFNSDDLVKIYDAYFNIKYQKAYVGKSSAPKKNNKFNKYNEQSSYDDNYEQGDDEHYYYDDEEYDKYDKYDEYDEYDEDNYDNGHNNSLNYQITKEQTHKNLSPSKQKQQHQQYRALIPKSSSKEINLFYKKQNILKSIKNDLYNTFYWLFSQNGLHYIIKNYNVSIEIFIHIICSLLIIIFNCIITTSIYPITSILFYIYIILFLSYIIFLFGYTKNIFSRIISQLSLLSVILLIYSNQIFLHGFVNIYYNSLFFIHFLTLCILSMFYLNNKRFIFKFTTQYFYFILFIYFAYFFLQNILSPNQIMNAQYGSFEIMNIYGSFGKIKKIRKEIIIEGTDSEKINDNTKWNTYEFYCKPDNIYKKMCTQFRLLYNFIPVLYIDRLDWQFNTLSDKEDETILENEWFKNFLIKLSNNDKNILSLLYKNPFDNKNNRNNQNKIFLRISNATYKFTQNGKKNWWDVVSSKVIINPPQIPKLPEQVRQNVYNMHEQLENAKTIKKMNKEEDKDIYDENMVNYKKYNMRKYKAIDQNMNDKESSKGIKKKDIVSSKGTKKKDIVSTNEATKNDIVSTKERQNDVILNDKFIGIDLKYNNIANNFEPTDKEEAYHNLRKIKKEKDNKAKERHEKNFNEQYERVKKILEDHKKKLEDENEIIKKEKRKLENQKDLLNKEKQELQEEKKKLIYQKKIQEHNMLEQDKKIQEEKFMEKKQKLTEQFLEQKQKEDQQILERNIKEEQNIMNKLKKLQEEKNQFEKKKLFLEQKKIQEQKLIDQEKKYLQQQQNKLLQIKKQIQHEKQEEQNKVDQQLNEKLKKELLLQNEDIINKKYISNPIHNNNNFNNTHHMNNVKIINHDMNTYKTKELNEQINNEFESELKNNVEPFPNEIIYDNENNEQVKYTNRYLNNHLNDHLNHNFKNNNHNKLNGSYNKSTQHNYYNQDVSYFKQNHNIYNKFENKENKINNEQANNTLQKFTVDENIKYKLDNAIKNSYSKYNLLNNYTNKINKLGLLDVYKKPNNFSSISELNYKPNEKYHNESYITDALKQNNE
ncbi:rhoptry protein ROP14 [Plasmodium gaboni]|uniref:Rhoptry protein ROP14 n=1 Tax=Plasmodium gaboni TaxID=647221 RepID=A0ABY1UMU8_9APIC|nr:rhoptry protein ROP14 [Plasmodium gaboni]